MKLIDKDALVAEIEKRLNYRIESLKTINNGTFWKEGQSEDEFNESLTRCAFNAAKNELFELKCFTDTLEVKEVNLEEETDKYFADWTTVSEYGDTVKPNCCGCSLDDCKNIAKHFFELGLSVSNNTKVTTPDIDDVLKENGVNPYSKEAKIIKESYFMAIEKLTQKGE